jgi:hypothetical protein
MLDEREDFKKALQDPTSTSKEETESTGTIDFTTLTKLASKDGMRERYQEETKLQTPSKNIRPKRRN